MSILRLLGSSLILLAISATAAPRIGFFGQQQAATTAPAAWAPTNAFFWVTATNGVNGGTTSPANGTAVTEWDDSSGNGNHLYEFLSAAYHKPPYFTNNVANGFPAVHFLSSVTNALTNTANLYWQPETLIFVSRIVETGQGSALIDGIKSGYRPIVNSAGTVTHKMSIGSTAQSSPDAMPLSWTVFTICFNGASSYVRTNGVAWYTVGGTIGTNYFMGMTLGRYFNDVATAYPMNGEFAEIIGYKGEPSAAARAWVETNLLSKYGLPLPP